ncbi:hypothetical protein A2U01_0114744, partial [Trifolium medium]|nr:hypothetical protein [Trifolium medium]
MQMMQEGLKDEVVVIVVLLVKAIDQTPSVQRKNVLIV